MSDASLFVGEEEGMLSDSCLVGVSRARAVRVPANFDWSVNPFAPEPPVTAREDPRPFYPL